MLDPKRFKQILYDLASNAIKFNNPGGRVEIEAMRAGVDCIQIEVRDDGIGIAENDLPRLFSPFQQLNAEQAGRPPGTGLGLALTKRFVELMGGQVEVESRLDRGSTFSVKHPTTPTGALR